MKKRILQQIFPGIVTMVLVVSPALADTIGNVTLTDGNSTMTFRSDIMAGGVAKIAGWLIISL